MLSHVTILSTVIREDSPHLTKYFQPFLKHSRLVTTAMRKSFEDILCKGENTGHNFLQYGRKNLHLEEYLTLYHTIPTFTDPEKEEF